MDDKRRRKPQYPMKLRLDGDWRLVLRGIATTMKLTPLMIDISPTEINFRADWRWGQVAVGDMVMVELHLSPEEGGPTLHGRITRVAKDQNIDYIYGGTVKFEKPTGDQRRQIDYFLRRLHMRERMGLSTQHLV